MSCLPPFWILKTLITEKYSWLVVPIVLGILFAKIWVSYSRLWTILKLQTNVIATIYMLYLSRRKSGLDFVRKMKVCDLGKDLEQVSSEQLKKALAQMTLLLSVPNVPKSFSECAVLMGPMSCELSHYLTEIQSALPFVCFT